MECYKKASLSSKVWRKYIIKISLVGTVSLVGLVLAIASIISGRFLFALWYLVAFVLGLSYVIIRINTALPTYIAVDGEKLILSVWNNGVFPYKVEEKPSFLSDFIPDRVRTDEIDFTEIDRIYIGSKRYLKKTLDESEYPSILSMLEEDKHIDAVLKKMDFILVFTLSRENCFMSITDFDIQALSEVIDIVERNCQGVKINIHLPKLVRFRNRNKLA